MELNEIESKVNFYLNVKFNISFNALHHTIVSFDKLLNPILTDFKKYDYLAYLLNRIDFEKLEGKSTIEESIKYSTAISYCFISKLRNDIRSQILIIQNSITSMNNEELKSLKSSIIPIVGNLQIQSSHWNKNIDLDKFTMRFVKLSQEGNLCSLNIIEYATVFEESLGIEILNSLNVLKESIIDYLGSLGTIGNRKSKGKPEIFEELFYDVRFAEIGLDVLRSLEEPIINAKNEFIGSSKGLIGVWLRCMLNFKPVPILKPFPNIVYAELLNKAINKLELHPKGSELSKKYKRIDESSLTREMITLFSKFSK